MVLSHECRVAIYKKVAEELFRIYEGMSSLHFPEYFNNNPQKIRVSEQESKMVFSNLFFNNQIQFAVEAPTKTKHSFTGDGLRSGRYDLAIYEEIEKSFEIEYVIELKARVPREEQIRKDIEKFACSDLDCIWFHTLESADANTFKTLLKRINHSIENEREKITGNHNWDFVIAVLTSKKLYFFSEIISKDHIINLDNINCFSELL
jgi:hypothetical protein